MGALTSRPKIPEAYQPQVVTITQPAQPSLPDNTVTQNDSTDTPVTDNNATTDTPVPDNTETEIRIANLLRRNRGLTGTIQTGFRGLLSANGLVPQRKTLLGE